MKRAKQTKTMKHPTLRSILALARAARGLDRRQLADKSGLSCEIIQKLEYGSSDNPRLVTLRKIAKALHIPVANLLPQDEWACHSVGEFLEQTALERINSK